MPAKKDKQPKIDYRKHECRVFDRDEFKGTYIVYGGTPYNTEAVFACDIMVRPYDESDHKESRAYRLKRQRAGKSVAPLRKDTLHNELMVALGPEMSAKEAVQTLRLLAKKIEQGGLLLGRTSKDGDFASETVDGEYSEDNGR
jgi:hypothetical protein